MSITACDMTGGDTGALGRLPMLAPPLAALLYPFALEGFHTSVARIAEGASILSWLSAAASLALAFAVPLKCSATSTAPTSCSRWWWLSSSSRLAPGSFSPGG